MRITLVLAAVTLSGCTTMRILPAGVSGNEAFVQISNVWNGSEALPYAEKHCAQYGRIARLNRTEGYTSIFDCVPRSSPQPAP